MRVWVRACVRACVCVRVCACVCIVLTARRFQSDSAAYKLSLTAYISRDVYIFMSPPPPPTHTHNRTYAPPPPPHTHTHADMPYTFSQFRTGGCQQLAHPTYEPCTLKQTIPRLQPYKTIARGVEYGTRVVRTRLTLHTD